MNMKFKLILQALLLIVVSGCSRPCNEHGTHSAEVSRPTPIKLEECARLIGSNNGESALIEEVLKSSNADFKLLKDYYNDLRHQQIGAVFLLGVLLSDNLDQQHRTEIINYLKLVYQTGDACVADRSLAALRRNGVSVDEVKKYERRGN
jgi:hypothetical protein